MNGIIVKVLLNVGGDAFYNGTIATAKFTKLAFTILLVDFHPNFVKSIGPNRL